MKRVQLDIRPTMKIGRGFAIQSTTEYCYFLRGYLRYKTITFQNVSSNAQVRIFLFHRKVMFRSQDIKVFVFLTIP